MWTALCLNREPDTGADGAGSAGCPGGNGQYAGLLYPSALLFSALRHFMVAKDSLAPEAGFKKPAPFYGEKMAHFITSQERQIDELRCHAIL